MATGVGVRELAPLIWSTHKTPLQLEINWSNLVLCKLSYSHVCTEIRMFSLSWQQGSMSANYDCHRQAGRPPKPYWMQVYWLNVLRKVSYCQFCVKIGKFSLPW